MCCFLVACCPGVLLVRWKNWKHRKVSKLKQFALSRSRVSPRNGFLELVILRSRYKLAFVRIPKIEKLYSSFRESSIDYLSNKILLLR